MSGLEIVGAISGLITLIEASISVWKKAHKDLKLGKTFETVANQLPLLRNTLEACIKHFESIEASLPDDTKQAITSTIQSCRSKARTLCMIFRQTIPDKDTNWYGRYRIGVQRAGKGSKVEELMQAILQDTQILVNYNLVKSAGPELHDELAESARTIESLEPSLPIDEANPKFFNSYEGAQNVSTANSIPHNNINQGSGTMNSIASITGNPVFHAGYRLQGLHLGAGAQAHFGDQYAIGSLKDPRGPPVQDYEGSYAYNALTCVSTYVDRPSLRQHLEKLLRSKAAGLPTKTQILVVHGIGGADKIQLVLDYAHRHRQDYSGVFWIDAKNPTTIERDYIEVFVPLYNLIEQRPQEPIKIEHAIPAIKQWFRSRGRDKRWLFVFDNAGNVTDRNDASFVDLRHFLPDDPTIDVIITSRDRTIGDISELPGVEVEEMSSEEAVTLFQRQAKMHTSTLEQAAEVHAIARELGYLALAITLAGSYVAQIPRLRRDLTQYLPEYRERRKVLLRERPTWPRHQYGESVLTTWETTYQMVQRQNPNACEFLAVLSYLHEHNIPARFPMHEIKDDVSMWTSRLFPFQRLDQYDVEGFYRVLNNFSLVRYREEQDSYSMHGLVQAWAYDRLNIDHQRHYCHVAALLLQAVIHSGKEMNLVTHDQYVPHVLSIFRKFMHCYESESIGNVAIHDPLEALKHILRSCDRYKDEVPIDRFMLRQSMLWYGEDDWFTVSAKRDLADALGEIGEFREALRLQQELVAQSERKYGRNDQYAFIANCSLMLTLIQTGKPQEALRVGRDLASRCLRNTSWDDVTTLPLIYSLADTLVNLGKPREALTLLRAVRTRRQSYQGPDHSNTLGYVSAMSNCLKGMGQLEGAIICKRLAVEGTIQKYGEDDTASLYQLESLADLLAEAGQLQEALELGKSVLAKMQRLLGRNHSITLASMNILALTHTRSGELQEALLTQQDVVRRLSELLPGRDLEQHPNMIEPLMGLKRLDEQVAKRSEFCAAYSSLYNGYIR